MLYLIFTFSESLHVPTIQVAPASDGVLVTIEPPSPAVPSATTVEYQLIISEFGNEERTMTLSPNMR